MSPGMQAASRSWKRQDNGFCLHPPAPPGSRKECGSPDILTLAQETHSDLQNCNIIHWWCCRPLRWQSFVTAALGSECGVYVCTVGGMVVDRGNFLGREGGQKPLLFSQIGFQRHRLAPRGSPSAPPAAPEYLLGSGSLQGPGVPCFLSLSSQVPCQVDRPQVIGSQGTKEETEVWKRDDSQEQHSICRQERASATQSTHSSHEGSLCLPQAPRSLAGPGRPLATSVQGNSPTVVGCLPNRHPPHPPTNQS